MTFDKVLHLLKKNASPSQWNHVSLSDGSVSYCREDVNLWSDWRVVWDENRRPLLQTRILYNATVVVAVTLPLGPEDQFGALLDAAISKLTE